MQRLGFALCLVAGLAALTAAAFSLAWRMEHDSPILFYLSWLIDVRGRAPYVGVFDMDLPGTFVLHAIFGRVFGYGDDLGFRIGDLLLLGLLGLGTVRALAPLDRRAGWFAFALYSLAYFSGGPRMSFQREAFVVAFLALALWATTAPALRWRALWVGLALGVASQVKPHALLLGLPLVVYLVATSASSSDDSGDDSGDARVRRPARWQVIATLAVAGALPHLAMLAWLASVGSLGAFLAMARGYWPLYGQLSQHLTIIAGAERWPYLARGLAQLGGSLVLLPALVLAALWGLRAVGRAQRPQVWLLVAVAAAAALYPVASGQFWDYHWLPFRYGAALVASLLLLRPRTSEAHAGPSRATAWFVGAGLAALCVGTPLATPVPDALQRQLRGERPRPPKLGRVDAIEAYLEQHVGDGETLQPLDWSGGAVHAMLRARLEPATSYTYDFYFYHHPDDPFTQGLRRSFLEQLNELPPDWFVEVQGLKPVFPPGPQIAESFPELERFLADGYEVVHAGRGFLMHRRRP